MGQQKIGVLISGGFLVLAFSAAAEAYVGPGAGFAFFSAFFLVFASLVLAGILLLLWPVRGLARALKHGRRPGSQQIRQVVILGLDGLDPELVGQYLEEGILPHLTQMREQGSFRRLATTLPAESPVAWASFQTGCNPGKHRIYDFLIPNRRSLRPELAAARVQASPRLLKLGRYRIPLSRPLIRGGRRSRPFWQVLAEHGIFSSVLRVPMSFPPEPFGGVLLSGMGLPDLRGSQGTYFYFTSDPDEHRELKSGLHRHLVWQDGIARGTIPGPANPLVPEAGELEVNFAVRPLGEGQAELTLGRERYLLRQGEYTPWVRLTFRPGLGFKVQGLCRFLLLENSPHLRLYATPLQIDPAHPALPISHPWVYSVYLAKSLGPFATLGVAEDASALNEGILDEEAFLAQCQDLQAEREAIFFDALEKTPQGVVVCVFDLADRIQHLFWRWTARPGEPYGQAIREAYRALDDLVGRVRRRLSSAAVMLVISDHGFKPFQRQVDLNAYLRDQGYLAVRKEAPRADLLQAVDWEQTRAYALGFGGIYLNLVGREARGIVPPGEAAAQLKRDLAASLIALRDGEQEPGPVAQVYDGAQVYWGPYAEEAPDLVVGFRPGYRVSWQTATGGVGEQVFADNLRPWSADHSFDPAAVPGVLFCDRPVSEEQPRIIDIAPTILALLGVPVPAYMDGKPLKIGES